VAAGIGGPPPPTRPLEFREWGKALAHGHRQTSRCGPRVGPPGRARVRLGTCGNAKSGPMTAGDGKRKVQHGDPPTPAAHRGRSKVALTPDDVETKEFVRVMRGYDPAEVATFL